MKQIWFLVAFGLLLGAVLRNVNENHRQSVDSSGPGFARKATVSKIKSVPISSSVDLLRQNPYLLSHRLASLATSTEGELIDRYRESGRAADEPYLLSLFIRWVELSPKGALAAVRNSGNQYHLRLLIGVWSEHDPDTVLQVISDDEMRRCASSFIKAVAATNTDRAIDLAIVHHKKVLGNQLLKNLAQDEPTRAAKLIETHFSRLENEEAIIAVGQAWAASDPEAALTWAGKLPRLIERQAALAAVLETLLDQDPAMAEQAISILPSGRVRAVLAAKRAQSKAQARPEEAMGWAKSLPEGLERSMALSGLAEMFAETDPIRALETLAEATTFDWSIAFDWAALFEKTVPAIAESDPRAALRLLDKIRVGGTEQRVAVGSLVEQLASRDDVLQILADTPGGPVQQEAVAAYFRVAQLPSLEELQGFVATLADHSKKEPFVNSMAHKYIYEEPTSTMTWLSELPAELSEPAIRNALSHLSLKDPEQASELLSMVTHEPTRVSSIEQMVGTITKAQVAIDLIRQLPEGRAEDFADYAYTFAKDDPETTSIWVAGFDVGAGRDKAIVGMTRALSYGGRSNSVRDHERAFQWARTMTDPAGREATLTRIVHAWNRQDPNATVRFLESATVLPSEKELLTKLVTP